MSIDSITLSIAAGSVPFQKYVRQSEGIKKRIADNRQIVKRPDGFGYTITYHHAHRRYYFKFFDLNILRKSGYTDAQALKFLRNVVREFFDFRVDLDHFTISELHVCRQKRFRSQAARHRFLAPLHKSVSKRASSALTHLNNPVDEKVLATLSETCYYNMDKSRDITFCIYEPRTKSNANRPPDDEYDVAKMELRLRTSAKIRQKRFPVEIQRFTSLCALVKNEDWASSLFMAGLGVDPESFSYSDEEISPPSQRTVA